MGFIYIYLRRWRVFVDAKYLTALNDTALQKYILSIAIVNEWLMPHELIVKCAISETLILVSCTILPQSSCILSTNTDIFLTKAILSAS